MFPSFLQALEVDSLNDRYRKDSLDDCTAVRTASGTETAAAQVGNITNLSGYLSRYEIIDIHGS